MNDSNNFMYLDHSKKTKKYMTEIILFGQTVIPSDTFWLEKNEFVILDFLKENQITIIKILGIKGPALGQIFLIPQNEFENITTQKLSLYTQS